MERWNSDSSALRSFIPMGQRRSGIYCTGAVSVSRARSAFPEEDIRHGFAAAGLGGAPESGEVDRLDGDLEVLPVSVDRLPILERQQVHDSLHSRGSEERREEPREPVLPPPGVEGAEVPDVLR